MQRTIIEPFRCVQLWFSCSLNTKKKILGRTLMCLLIRCKGVATNVGIWAASLDSKNITNKNDGENYTNRPQVVKNWIFFSGFTWDRITFTRKQTSQVWSLLSYLLHTVHALFWKVHRQKKTSMELLRMLPGLVLPSDCAHIPLFTASAFHFFLVYFLSHALIPT